MPERRFPPPWTVEDISRMSRAAISGEIAHPQRGAAHRGQHREAAGLAAQDSSGSFDYINSDIAPRMVSKEASGRAAKAASATARCSGVSAANLA
jgi:hypothetical protein